LPELPEVEHVRRRLNRAIQGDRIERVELRRSDLRAPFPCDFVERLEGETVNRITRRAKYLLVELSGGETLLMHLGMSGSFRIERPVGPEVPGRFHYERGVLERHDHVVFDMASGVRVVFNDPRRFGHMALIAGDAVDRAISALGPEPLSRRFDAHVLARALRGKKTSLKAALSDQAVVAGLGNIYVCEALHEARLSPERPAASLVTRTGEPREALTTLVAAIRQVLRTAIRRQARYRGDDDRFRVYDREGERCLRRRCTGTIRRIVQGGRSTFYCPVCQR
jgi:formamidopyrimidine-DNA glycosylase